MKGHTITLVQVPDEAADLGAEGPLHWTRLGRDHMHFEIALAQRRGDFEPDEARANDHGTMRTRGRRNHRPAVAEVAEIEYVPLIRAW